ncbi:hypothetical protein [Rhodococcus triatomae]|nr:hypothetical protein G419_13796 [Rhodococcus triatomae BKS 15-14]
MRRFFTAVTAGSIVAAGLLSPAVASAQGSSANPVQWCDDAEFSLGCYTDGTPKVPDMSFWEAREYAEQKAKDAAEQAEADNPTPSFFDNIRTIIGWIFGGSSDPATDDEETEEEATPAPEEETLAPDEEETPAPEVADSAAE